MRRHAIGLVWFGLLGAFFAACGGGGDSPASSRSDAGNGTGEGGDGQVGNDGSVLPSPDGAGGTDANVAVDVTPGDGGGASMTFFVTSVGNGGSGGNYGGLAGADARCQQLATVAGRGSKTWHAYLSTAPFVVGGGALVHARDRIGPGPWLNFNGAPIAANVAALHANPPSRTLMLTEKGEVVPTNEHDIVTGTMADGTAFVEFPFNPGSSAPNCANWTSTVASDFSYVGHFDWDNGSTAASWNSAHESGCDQAGLTATASSARLYCFAIN